MAILRIFWQLLGVVDDTDVVTASCKDGLGIRLLKILRAYFDAGDLRRNSQHRHAAALTIVQAVDEMQIARSAAAGAHGQCLRQVRFGPRSKGGDLFMSDVHPLQRARGANGLGLNHLTNHRQCRKCAARLIAPAY